MRNHLIIKPAPKFIALLIGLQILLVFSSFGNLIDGKFFFSSIGIVLIILSWLTAKIEMKDGILTYTDPVGNLVNFALFSKSIPVEKISRVYVGFSGAFRGPDFQLIFHSVNQMNAIRIMYGLFSPIDLHKLFLELKRVNPSIFFDQRSEEILQNATQSKTVELISKYVIFICILFLPLLLIIILLNYL